MVDDVLFVGVNYAPEPSGTAPFTADAAAYLAARGKRTSVVTGVPHYPTWRIDDSVPLTPRWDNVSGVRIRRLRHFVPPRQTLALRLRYELSFAIRTIPVLLKECISARPVVVAVVPGLISALIALLVTRATRRPLVVWLQDSVHRGASQSGLARRGIVTRALRSAEDLVLRNAWRVICISDDFRRQVVERGVCEERVEVIRNWSFLPVRTGSRAVTRRELGWPSTAVVLHAGNMGLKQGLHAVVEAARSAPGGYHFALAGDGSQKRALAEAGSDLANLGFHDSLDNDRYVDALAAADVLLLCESPEVVDMSLPSKLAAYCQSGTPIVAYVRPEGSTAREVERGGCAVVVDNSRAPGAINEAITRLLGDEQLHATLTENARRYAAANYERSTNLERLLRVLDG